MRHAIFASALLATVALPIVGAQAAVDQAAADQRIGAALTTVIAPAQQVARESSEGARREDRRQDRRQDRRNDRRSSDASEPSVTQGTIILAREGAASGGHRQRRGGEGGR